MAKKFDATTKALIDAHPADWLAFAGMPAGGRARVVETDVSTFTSMAADKVIRVGGRSPYVGHFELASGHDRDLDGRVLVYNILIHRQHGLPVLSVVILLRPEAESASVRGGVEYRLAADGYLDFRYRLIRLWEQPAAAVLKGGLGTLPLAPLCAVAPRDLPAVLDEMEHRFAAEAEPAAARELRTATYILMGLRYPRETVDQLLKGARQMKESTTYQAILEEGMAKGMERGMEKGIEKGIEKGRARGMKEGRAKGIREGRAEGMRDGHAEGKVAGERALLIRLGSLKFGPPGKPALKRIEAITDLDDLESLAERILTVSSWDALLKMP